MRFQTVDELKEETELLLAYAVPPEHRAAAAALLDRYATDRIGLNLLHAFYSFLPEGEEDGVRELRLLASREGTFLLAAVTFRTAYLYLVTLEDAVFLGDHAGGVWEQEVLDFFGFRDRQHFLKEHRELAAFPEHQPVGADTARCPVCAVADGEQHVFGCPAEVCPWCDGQLTRCNCRFTQLGAAWLASDEQIDALREKAEKKGRIPFDSSSQRAGYPAGGNEDDEGERPH